METIPRAQGRAWRRWSSVLCAAILVAGAVFDAIAPSLHAMQVPLTEIQLVARSTHIVRGQVVGLRSEWNQDLTQIYTLVDIRVDQTLKGSVPTPWLKLRVLGGVVGDIRMNVFDMPSFKQNEEMYLFLKTNHEAFLPVAGGEQGKVTIVRDPATGAKLAKGRVGSGATIDDFERRIRAAIADTTPIVVGDQIVPPLDAPVVPDDGGTP